MYLKKLKALIHQLSILLEVSHKIFYNIQVTFEYSQKGATIFATHSLFTSDKYSLLSTQNWRFVK